ncbi:MAG: hypothetical protein AABW92_04200 [Nanoarchaeota archaeon]
MAKLYKVRKKCLICGGVFYPKYAGSLYCENCKNKKSSPAPKPVKPKSVKKVKVAKKTITKKPVTKKAVKKVSKSTKKPTKKIAKTTKPKKTKSKK